MEREQGLNHGLKLPRIISDGMILQRNQEIKIWGQETPGIFIDVYFAGRTYTAVGDKEGNWKVVMPAMEAGGPYEMVVTVGNKKRVVVNDILIGDLWLCGGQSNMELPISRVMELYKEEVEAYENPKIRMFQVPITYNFNEPQKDFKSGYWHRLTKTNVKDFTAVGYFFAKALYEKYCVPIGLVQTAVGGTPIEAWMSEGALKDFPCYLEQSAKYKDETCIQRTLVNDITRINAWYSRLDEIDLSFKEREAIKGRWYETKERDGWKICELPSFLVDEDLAQAGSIWYRKEIQVPEQLAGKMGRMVLGTIVDNDHVYINGSEIGFTSDRNAPRIYEIPLGTLKEGKNVIVVRVCFERGEVGFTPDKPLQIEIGSEVINLQGEWQYKLGGRLERLEYPEFIQFQPMGVYNGMIAPLRNMKFKGVIWYQGESNGYHPDDYKALFEGLIRDWRQTLQCSDLPFLYVQLPNFAVASEDYYNRPVSLTDEVSNTEIEGGWTKIRQAQLEALEIPNTAMVVTLDVGEWNDLHPLNKKDIGERLALAARAVVYKETINYCSPVGQAVQRDEDKLIITFKPEKAGLMVKGNELNQFIISNDGKHFYRGHAQLMDEDKVVVWHEKVKTPVEVRYAWADNPKGANLYGQNGLPVSPFRLDI